MADMDTVTTFRLPAGLHQRLKIYAARQQQSMGEVLAQALEKFMTDAEEVKFVSEMASEPKEAC